LNRHSPVLTMLALGTAAFLHAQSPAPSKIALIDMRKAILSTKEGQKAQIDLQAKFLPRKQQLDGLESQLQTLRDQLQKGSATMSDEAKSKLMRDIDARTKSLQRDAEDYQADVQAEEGKLMNEVGGKLMDVVIKYATANGYALVVDVGNPQTSPVLWAAPDTVITDEIVKLYDPAHPVTEAVKPAAPPAPQVKK